MRPLGLLFLAATVLGACSDGSMIDVNPGSGVDVSGFAFPDSSSPDAGPGDVADDVPPPADLQELDTAAPPDPGAPPPDLASAEDTPSVAPSGAKLVINEVMYNPAKVDDELGEWVEVYNAGAEAVDLKGWTLRDKASNHHVVASSVSVAPGGYAVLGRNGDITKNGGYAADYVYGEDFFLANGGDSVVLEDPSGAVVDEVSYKGDVPWPEAANGLSLELVAPDLDNALPASWALAVATYGDGDKGTPGGPNGAPKKAFTIDDAVEDWQQPALKASLRFSPNDGLEPYIVSMLSSAKVSVHMAYFNVRLPGIPTLLKGLQAQGVDVHVVLDKKQQDLAYNTMGKDLADAGIPVTLLENTNATEATMHDKFTVVDGLTVITGSANLSDTALNKSDEDLLTVEDADLAARFEAEFQELVAGGAANEQKSAPYAAGAPLQAWFGPEDDLDGAVKALLDGAKSQVFLAMFQINLPAHRDALIAAKGRGVTVLAILDQIQAEGETDDEALVAAGVPVIYAHNQSGEFTEMHSKFAVVDGEALAIGSYNWTALATFHNDENLLVVHDEALAARAAGKFAELVTTYGTQAPASYGLYTGDAEVTFSLTNVGLEPGAVAWIQGVGPGLLTPGKAMSGTSLTVTVPAGTRLEYRYTIKGPGSSYTESGEKHWFTVPFGPGPYSVPDAFRP